MHVTEVMNEVLVMRKEVICYPSGESAFARMSFLNEEIILQALPNPWIILSTVLHQLFEWHRSSQALSMSFEPLGYMPFLLSSVSASILSSHLPIPQHCIFQKDMKDFLTGFNYSCLCWALTPVFLTTMFSCLWTLCGHGLLLHLVFTFKEFFFLSS